MGWKSSVASAWRTVAANGMRLMTLLSLLSVLYGTQAVAVDLMQEKLKGTDLKDKTCEELRIMRNEIFARHGRKFGNPKIREHFLGQPWYHPQFEPGDFPGHKITNIQNANIEHIKHFEEEKECKSPSQWGILEWSAAVGAIGAIIGAALAVIEAIRRFFLRRARKT